MPDSSFRPLAECEPSPFLRDKMKTDLRIDGLMSTPTKVDMRAIQPVYVMGQAIQETLSPVCENMVNVPIDGVETYSFNVVAPLPPIIMSKVQAVRVIVDGDPEGRILITATNTGYVNVDWWLRPPASIMEETYLLRRTRFKVGALVSTGFHIECGLNDNGIAATDSGYQGLKYQPPFMHSTFPIPFLVPLGWIFGVSIVCPSNTWPANTLLSWNSYVLNQI